MISKDIKFKEKTSKYIILPNDRYLLLWEFVQFIVIVSFFFIISIDLIYSEKIWNFESEGGVEKHFDIYILCLLILLLFADMVLKLNVAYVDRGRIIKERSKIIKFYLFSLGFLIDLISIIVIVADFFYKEFFLNICTLIFIFKLYNIL